MNSDTVLNDNNQPSPMLAFIKFAKIRLLSLQLYGNSNDGNILTITTTFSVSGGSRTCKRGAKVERRRREYRGAQGAEGDEMWKGVF